MSYLGPINRIGRRAIRVTGGGPLPMGPEALEWASNVN